MILGLIQGYTIWEVNSIKMGIDLLSLGNKANAWLGWGSNIYYDTVTVSDSIDHIVYSGLNAFTPIVTVTYFTRYVL